MALPRHNSDGQTVVTYRPRWWVVGQVLHRQAAVFLILLVPPCLAAVAEAQTALAFALGAPCALTALAHVTGRNIEIASDLRRIEAVLSVVAVFVLSCVITAPSYFTLGLDPLDALFEATSAMTTTGFSMATSPESWPVSAHLLRAWSQWCGGLVIAVAGLAFLMDHGPVSRALGIADFGDSGMHSSAPTHAKALLLAYLGITLFSVAGAFVLVPGYWEGPFLALTAVSTGGMAPRADSLASYPASAQIFLVGMSSLGAVSLALPVLAYRHGWSHAARATALLSVGKAFAFSILAYSALHVALHGFQVAPLGPALLNLLSQQSTTGFTVAPLTGEAPFLLLLIAFMLTGGQTGSTAGGLKIERMRVLFGIFMLVLRRLLNPVHALTYLRLDGERVDLERILFTSALVATYLISTFVLWVAFTAAGAPPLPALFDIVSALSTVGAGTGVIGPDLPAGLKALTILAMLLGRLEFFGLLVLALPRTWIRRD